MLANANHLSERSYADVRDNHDVPTKWKAHALTVIAVAGYSPIAHLAAEHLAPYADRLVSLRAEGENPNGMFTAQPAKS